MRWLAIACVLVACSSKKDAAKKTPPPPGDAAVVAIDAPPPVPSSIQLAARYTRCLHAATVGAWDAYARCHAAGAILETAGVGKRTVDEEIARLRADRARYQMYRREAELSITRPGKLVAVEWFSATTANRPIGIYIGHVVEFDEAGLITRDVSYFDSATLRGQLGEPIQGVRPAAGDWDRQGIYEQTGSALETANAEVYRDLVVHRNHHDPTRFAALLADNYVTTDYAYGEWPKQKLVDALRRAWQYDRHEGVVTEQMWAAGDYIAAIERYEATTSGSAVEKLGVQVLGIYALRNGKIEHGWFFRQR